MKVTLILALSVMLFISGCAHYLSEQSRRSADRDIAFVQLLEAPDAFRGKLVMLGGIVAAIERTGEGTQLEIIQHRLDSRELPDEAIPSGGRFLATTSAALDPDRYGPGALVTLAGEVVGKRVQPLGGAEYTYPVIAIKEIHDIVIEQETHWGSFGGI
jgi:outer membrane lipoprotein